MIALLDAGLPEAEASEAGFAYFHNRQERGPAPAEDATRSVLQAFLSGGSMESVVEQFTRIETKVVEAELRDFMASGLLRLKGDALTSVCDVSARTLRNWKK